MPLLNKPLGFTIIDALFALAIFSIATFTYLYQIQTANSSITRQASSIYGNIIAENIAEDLSMKSFTDTALLQAYNASHRRYFSKSLVEVTSAGNPKYIASWDVTENAPIAGNRTIVIKVAWQDGFTGSSFTLRIVR
tara:strand:+ start:46331 stop:46741 length:411 start_codon:yes stop_codon:yes gene_type:complete